MVAIKISVVLLFIITGIFYVKPENWTPFLPFGIHGVMNGAATVFLPISALMPFQPPQKK